MESAGASPPDRAQLLADLAALRERERLLKRQARLIELGGAWLLSVLAALLFRAATLGGIGMSILGAGSWLFTFLVWLSAFVAVRGAVAAGAARTLVPARRDVAQAASRLHAHDAAHGRHGPPQ